MFTTENKSVINYLPRCSLTLGFQELKNEQKIFTDKHLMFSFFHWTTLTSPDPFEVTVKQDRLKQIISNEG